MQRRNELRRWLLTLCAIPALGSMGCIEGLHWAKPSTSIRAGHFRFENSKDVALQLQRGEYDPNTGRILLEGLDVTDSASPVRRANVEQIDAAAREMDVILGQVNQMIGFLAAKLPDFGKLPAFQPTGGARAADIVEMLLSDDRVLEAIARRVAGRLTPATQPVR